MPENKYERGHAHVSECVCARVQVRNRTCVSGHVHVHIYVPGWQRREGRNRALSSFGS